MLGFCYLHVIYSRVPMVESMLALTMLAAFWLALGGRRHLFLSGLIIGVAAFMVKLHVGSFGPGDHRVSAAGSRRRPGRQEEVAPDRLPRWRASPRGR